MRWGAVLAAFMLTGCALSPHLPFVPPPNPPPLKLGVNLGPERMTPRYLDRLAASGTHLILRVPVTSQGQAKDVLQAVQPYPSLSVLLLVERPDLALVEALAPLERGFGMPGRLAGIELGNELDLYGLSPAQFAAFTSQALAILQRADWAADLVSGGIYTVDEDALAYAAPMLAQLPCAAIFGVHLYQDSGEDILAQLQQAAGCHRIAITESGLPSRTPAEDAAQTIYLREKIAAARRLGAASFVIYQLVSGPSASDLDNFGLLTFTDAPKPAMELLR